MIGLKKSTEFINILQNYNISIKSNGYSEQFKNYYGNRPEYDNFIQNKITCFINNILNSDNEADVNKIIKNFEYLTSLRLNEVYEKIGIKEICDLDKSKNNSEKRKMYNKYLYEIIINEKRKNQNNKNFIEYFQINILKSNIPSLIILTTILKRIEKYNKKNDINNENILTIKKTASELFDDDKYINNFIQYINNEYKNDEYDCQDSIKKKDIRQLILNMKSCGYLFFNKYLQSLYGKYLHKIDILEIEQNRKFVNYLIFTMRDSEEKVSIIVNKLLLLMKDYLDDIEDCYYNLLNYNKIDIKLSSDKYTKEDVNKLKRSCVNFNITKLLPKNDKNIYECNIPKEIAIYNDILKSYYNARYLDRIMKIDHLESFVKIRMQFDKTYIFEMNFLQYTILKLIFENDGVTINEIINNSKVNKEFIEKIINGFLKLQLIKRTNNNIDKTIFIINNDFCHEKTRLNIIHKINKITTMDDQYLFKKDKVIYCNIIDMLKKTLKIHSFEEICQNLNKRVPFKFTEDEVHTEITKGINIEDIKKLEENNLILYIYKV